MLNSSVLHGYLLVVLSALLLNACSDSSSPDDTNNGGDRGDGTSFAIVSIDQDTVYWGDTVNVRFRNAQTDSFTLYLHTVPLGIDSSWCDRAGNGGIRFKAPSMPLVGQIRIFEQDTIQAKNSPTLVVVSARRANLVPHATSFTPSKAYPGDLVTVTGRDIPQRWRDLEVSVAGKPLEIIGWDSAHILTRVPVGSKSGTLSVGLFDKRRDLGTLEILTHKGSLLQEGQLRAVRLRTSKFLGSAKVNFDFSHDTSFVTQPLPDLDREVTYRLVSRVPSADSIIFVTEETLGADTLWLDLRLKAEPESRVSGVIRMGYWSPAKSSWFDMSVKSMRWLQASGNSYILYANSTDVSKQLIDFRGSENNSDHVAFDSLTVKFGGGDANSAFSLELTP